MANQKIGVLGSGQVGQILASGFIKHGHAAMIGTRSAEKVADWKSTNGEHAHIGSVAETAAYGDIIVLAVKGSVAKTVLQAAGADNLKGKVIIDATNPISDAPPVNGVLQFFSDINRSLMEDLQDAFPDSHFVKAFNSVGNPRMVNPDFGGVKPTMFICGNDDAAKATVTSILDVFGWETADMGKVESARAIEPLCTLWCIPGFLNNQWTHAFKLLTS